jgi:periplasmic divalent cation tolerance protein
VTGATQGDAAAQGAPYVEVHVTAPDAVTATRLARTLVEERLAACVQVVPGVTSVYAWDGRVETADEHLLLVKSTAGLFEAIRERVRSEHPYDTPEVVALPVHAIDPRYAAWLTASVRSAGHPGPAETTEGDG